MKYLLVAMIVLSGCGVRSAPSCSIEKIPDGSTRISCPDGTSSVIPSGAQGVPGISGTNGINGKDGSNGTSPTLGPDTPMSLIHPCGVSSSPYKEALICLYNGTILASFSDSASGSNTRLALIPIGRYADTDSSGCNFSVALASDGSYSVSWDAGSSAYATWTASTAVCQKN